MPMYEFICSTCFKLLEFIVPLDKYDSKVYCPHCKKEVKRILSPTYFKVR